MQRIMEQKRLSSVSLKWKSLKREEKLKRRSRKELAEGMSAFNSTREMELT